MKNLKLTVKKSYKHFHLIYLINLIERGLTYFNQRALTQFKINGMSWIGLIN